MAGGWSSSNRKARLPSGWARIRAEILARDVTCQICHVRPSTHCDHIVAKADRNGPSDLQGVCGPCHDQKSSREGNDAQRANPKPGRRRPDEPHPGLR
jgi:5-methylcytosine-specific restriction endonuclease McrA